MTTDTARAADARGLVLMIEGQQPNARRRGRRGSGAATSALTAWVGVAPQSLLPDALADVIQLPPGSHPQAVRGYLERATRTRGPVLVYITGHLVPDKRTGALHLALNELNAAAVRYDGLPWTWLADNLRPRKDRQTLVIADLTTDPDTGRALLNDPTPVGAGLPLWGVLAPPPTGDTPPAAWTRTLVVAVRRGWARQPRHVEPSQIHHDITSRAALPAGALEWVPAPGTALPIINSMSAVTAPDLPDLPPPTTETVSLDGPTAMPLLPDDLTPPPPPPANTARTTAPTSDPRDSRRAAIEEAVDAGQPEQAIPIAAGMSAALDRDRGPLDPQALEALDGLAWLTHVAGRQAAAVPLYIKLARRYDQAGRKTGPQGASTAAEAAYTLWHSLDETAARQLAPDIAALLERLADTGPYAAHAATRLTALTTPPPEPAPPTPARAEPAPAASADAPPTDVVAATDAIHAMAEAGRVTEALNHCAGLISRVAREFGPDHPHTLSAREVYGYLLSRAERLADAVKLYADIARRRHRAGDAAGARAAADNAHALWNRMPPGDEAAAAGRIVVDIRSTVPGPGLRRARARLQSMEQSAPTPTPPPAAPPTPPQPERRPAPEPPATPAATSEPDAPAPHTDVPDHIRTALDTIAQAQAAGNHDQAADLADDLATTLESEHGPRHPHVLQARDLQAHTNALAGRTADATLMYVRLAQWHAAADTPESAAAGRASDAAAALWQHLGNTAEARALAPEIVELRTRIPGSDPEAEKAARAHSERLSRTTGQV